MLQGKRLQQCPGTALFLWWKFFEDHSFASYFVALPWEMPQGLKAIINTLINSLALIDGVKLREMEGQTRTRENITHIAQTY